MSPWAALYRRGMPTTYTYRHFNWARGASRTFDHEKFCLYFFDDGLREHVLLLPRLLSPFVKAPAVPSSSSGVILSFGAAIYQRAAHHAYVPPNSNWARGVSQTFDHKNLFTKFCGARLPLYEKKKKKSCYFGPLSVESLLLLPTLPLHVCRARSQPLGAVRRTRLQPLSPRVADWKHAWGALVRRARGGSC